MDVREKQPSERRLIAASVTSGWKTANDFCSYGDRKGGSDNG